MWWIMLSIGTLLLASSTSLMVVVGNRQLEFLKDQDPAGVQHWPSVSIIVAARDEQAHIASALASLLQIEYDDYEVIVVDDRSTDATPAILAELAGQYEQLRLLQIQELPSGWLGKNHALWFGARHARGEYLLFTDADVSMDPRILRRSMAYVLRQEVDHLTASPEPVMPSRMLQAFVVLFVDLFAIYTRPWKVADPKSKAFIGIGAFNLVRTAVYESVGRHQAIKMRPDDDVKLGKIIKTKGYRQRILIGTGMIRVPWYGSVRELISGMEKNAFSGVDYRISMVLLVTVTLWLVGVWPYLAVWYLEGWARLFYGGTVLVQMSRAWMTAGELKQSRYSIWLLPLAVALLIYIQWRAMLVTYLRDGIRWRGTHYGLAELKANKV